MSHSAKSDTPHPLAARVAVVMICCLSLLTAMNRMDWHHTTHYLASLHTTNEYVGL
ncbi:MAG: hypothetical protein KGJ06_09590 [Pseudomonadota bacterium]|nr:hypothetical protein [Pseudomonadota bacterium]